MTDLLEPQLDAVQLPADPLLVIQVTEDHISGGMPGDASSCAIAQALLERGFADVLVGVQLVWRSPDDQWHWAEMPPEAHDFIGRFDRYGDSQHWDDCPQDDCEGCYWTEPPEPITFAVEVQDGEKPPPHWALKPLTIGKESS